MNFVFNFNLDKCITNKYVEYIEFNNEIIKLFVTMDPLIFFGVLIGIYGVLFFFDRFFKVLTYFFHNQQDDYNVYSF